MYNRLKTMVHKIWNYRSKKWTNNKVIKLMLRSFTSHNATLVTLIHETLRYKMMSPEEVLVKFLSHDMMVKDSKHIEDLDLGSSACAR